MSALFIFFLAAQRLLLEWSKHVAVDILYNTCCIDGLFVVFID
jgi:hypothetical protein